MNNLNSAYTERRLGNFVDDINAHLSLLVSSVSHLLPICHKIHISKDEIAFDAFELDELNSVQRVLILLTIAVSPYDDSLLQEKWIVDIPEDMFFEDIEQNEWWDLFQQVVISAKGYCLFRAYHILVEKMAKRNTPLFRLLYICTCLELWRQKISPEIVAWPIWKWVHWWDLIVQLTNSFSKNAYIKFAAGGYGWFLDYLKVAVNEVSDAEVPDNIIRHFYSRNTVTGVVNQTSIVQWYLHEIMKTSKKPIQ